MERDTTLSNTTLPIGQVFKSSGMRDYGRDATIATLDRGSTSCRNDCFHVQHLLS
ncbi:MAG: hypothetical protein OXI23_07215 [Gemmatimonadota bacterium]|nr:hypothetical protein [Gemmatimonadota bacterium]